jgi:peptidoglycan/LPS O-acetylase OafA/YrhL
MHGTESKFLAFGQTDKAHGVPPAGVRAPLLSVIGAAISRHAKPASLRVEQNSLPLSFPTLAHRHIGSLDGFRGAAAMMVLFYHFGLNAKDMGLGGLLVSAAGAGWTGVDMFFVLSGFLITGILFDTKASENYFSHFYMRRCLRIFPLYFGAIIVVEAIGFLSPAFLNWDGTHPWWLPLFATNFVYAQQGGAVTGVMTHYWTLAIEEQFYLLWPLFVWLCDRRRLMAIAAAMIGAALALRIAMTLYQVHGEAIFSLTPTRMDSLAWGAFAALAIRGNLGKAGYLAPIAMLLSAAGLIAVITWRQTASPFDPLMQTAGYSLLGCLYASAIVASLSAGILRAIFLQPWLRWLGKYSFGIYVWHPIIGSMIFYGPHPPVARGVAGALLIFAGAGFLDLLAAWLSYHYWEKPFLLLKKYFPESGSRRALSEPDIACDQRPGEVG